MGGGGRSTARPAPRHLALQLGGSSADVHSHVGQQKITLKKKKKKGKSKADSSHLCLARGRERLNTEETHWHPESKAARAKPGCREAPKHPRPHRLEAGRPSALP